MIVLVQNNTKPDLALSLRRGGVAADLTGATVTFKLQKPSGAVITKAMSIQGPATAGKVACSWGVGDLDEAGACIGEVRVDYGAGVVQNGKYPVAVYVRAEFQENIG